MEGTACAWPYTDVTVGRALRTGLCEEELAAVGRLQAGQRNEEVGELVPGVRGGGLALEAVGTLPQALQEVRT